MEDYEEALKRIEQRFSDLGLANEKDGITRLYTSSLQWCDQRSELDTDHDLEELRGLALSKGIPEPRVRAEDFAERLITFTASDDSRDRYGDRITVDGKLGKRVFGDGWVLENFERNPVFMPFHTYDQLPLGTAIKTWRDIGGKEVKAHGKKSRKRLRMTVLMDDGSGNPLAPLMQNAYRSGLMKAVSVGFRPIKFHDPGDDDEREELDLGPRGVVFGTQELLENSAVSIPANPNAIAEKAVDCSDMKCFLRFADEARDVDPEFGYRVRHLIRTGLGQVYLNKLEKEVEGEMKDCGCASRNGLDNIETRGARLAALLNRLIDQRASEDRPREEVIASMAREARISVSTVNQILRGEIDCPPLDRLAGFARALDVSARRIVRAAEADGCEYDTEGLAADMMGALESLEEKLGRLQEKSDALEKIGEELDAVAAKFEALTKKVEDIAQALDAELEAISKEDEPAPAAPANGAPDGHVISEMLRIAKESAGLFGNDADTDKGG